MQIDRLDQAPRPSAANAPLSPAKPDEHPTTSPAVVPSPQKEPAMQLTVFEPSTVLDDLQIGRAHV